MPTRHIADIRYHAEPRTPELAQELATALHDLLAGNHFAPVSGLAGPYNVEVEHREQRLYWHIRGAAGESETVTMPLAPFKTVIRDYFILCDSYHEAVKSANSFRVEAVDMGRRGLHNEGSELLQTTLKSKIILDFETARRLFTLICVLHMK